MYSKAEVARIKKDFWTAFGVYMKPVCNAGGDNINWINYKTGIRNIYFRADVAGDNATVSIELNGPKSDRKPLFEKFEFLKSYFNEIVGNDWVWAEHFYDEDGGEISKIFTTLVGVNIFNKEDWPGIISFLKKNLIKLDDFWLPVKMQFEP